MWTGVTPGDGPQNVHVVLIDNGRTNVLADPLGRPALRCIRSVSYTHLRAHETVLDIVCRLLLDNTKLELYAYAHFSFSSPLNTRN